MNMAELRVVDLLQIMQRNEQAAHAPAMAPALMPVAAPDLPESYRHLSPQECRERLGRLRSEALQRASNKRWSSAESKEWEALSREHRMALHLLAGIDGDLETLALREWRELPGPERMALKAEVRAMRDAMKGIFSLSGNW